MIKFYYLCAVLMTKIIIIISLSSSSSLYYRDVCLTGLFTDVQSWAYDNGSLKYNISDKGRSLDLSGNENLFQSIQLILSDADYDIDVLQHIYIQIEDFDLKKHILALKYYQLSDIKFMSLAQNKLRRIPLYQSWAEGTSGKAWKHLQFLSLAGNNFSEVSDENYDFESYSVTINATDYYGVDFARSAYRRGKGKWVDDLVHLDLRNLIELDLRNCYITVLKDFMFTSMAKLRRLYLSENQIYQILPFAFHGLSNLIHLDLSKNTLITTTNETGLIEGMIIMKGTFKPMIHLKSLDFSYTKIVQTCATVFSQLSSKLQRLSLCYTNVPVLRNAMFQNSSIKYLDISGNLALEDLNVNTFDGIEETLQVLYANKLGIKNIKALEYLKNLKILSLTDNDIALIDKIQLSKLKHLEILDLANNRILPWNTQIFSQMKKLQLLQIKKNGLSLMTQQMYADLTSVKMISFGLNSFVCNCPLNQIYEGSLRDLNESLCFPKWIKPFEEVNKNHYDDNNVIEYHDAYRKYGYLATQAHEYDTDPVVCDKHDKYDKYFIYDMDDKEYTCTDMKNNRVINLENIQDCLTEDMFLRNQQFGKTEAMIIALSVIALLILITVLIVWKWWYIRYFLLMMKNTAILSIMSKDTEINEADRIYVYDVFISYCDGDRDWVLEYLLPQIESHSSIRVCLHERDFQVGLSILENIISCIDRSKTLLMIVSNKFLMSQWCQFEMHLAQHRLLETRREHLILVLLENIPRRRRPNTLHYLMMTKTYIVWPPDDKGDEHNQFWKRLRRAILFDKNNTDKISIA